MGCLSPTVLQFVACTAVLHVTLEEGTCAAWLHDVLKPSSRTPDLSLLGFFRICLLLNLFRQFLNIERKSIWIPFMRTVAKTLNTTSGSSPLWSRACRHVFLIQL